MKSIHYFLILLTITVAKAYANDPVIKQSKSGICHDERSASCNRTKNYTAYSSMAACIEAGGRLPKGLTKQVEEATEDAQLQGRALTTLYDRNDWPHWLDGDKDCQNTRHELLLATSTEPVSFKTEKECNVFTGSWYDPYSAFTFTNSKQLDLDHIVPLKFAHGQGGDVWTRERKSAFANDLDNLLLVDASLNRQKGAKGLTEWLPPNQQYRCEYIKRFNFVMNKYDLAFIPKEQRIVNQMIKACSN